MSNSLAGDLLYRNHPLNLKRLSRLFLGFKEEADLFFSVAIDD